MLFMLIAERDSFILPFRSNQNFGGGVYKGFSACKQITSESTNGLVTISY
jgi:hypothetical protein